MSVVVRRQVLLPILFTVALTGSFVDQLPGVQLLVYACAPLSLAVAALTPGHRLLTRRFPAVVVAFLFWTVASVLWSADRGGTVRDLVDLATNAMLAIAAGLVLTLDDLHRAVSRVARILLVATALALVVAPGWSTEPAGDGAPGWHGPFDHKNGLGAFLVLAGITLYFDRRRRRAPWFVLIGVLLVGSQSSTALALLLLAGALVLWQRGLGSLRTLHQRSLYLGASVTSLALVTVVAVTRPDLFAAVLGRDPTFTGRTDIWGAVIRQIAERPLTGHGWGGVWREASLPTLQIWREARFDAFYAHNGYLDVLLQIGAIGLALLLLVLLPALVRLWRTRSRDTSFWGALVIVTGLVAAVSESAPFVGSDLILLFAVALAARQPEMLAALRARRRGAPTVPAADLTPRADAPLAPAGAGPGPGRPGPG